MDFKSLKRNSGTSVERLNKAVADQANKSTFKREEDEEGFWKPTRDKAGNGSAVIRFLPAPPQDGEEGLPWVNYLRYSFKGVGGWYINRSLVSLGQPDPVAEHYYKLRNSGRENEAKKLNRTSHWVSNILVISDPAHPENEGKVFKYSYGKKIYEKIQEKMNPSFEGEEGVDPFDFWTGCNFKMKIKTVKGDDNQNFPNYDNSEFSAPSALFKGDEAKLETLWRSQYSLKEVIDVKHYKSYDDLKAQLHKVLGIAGDVAPKAEETKEEQTEVQTTVKQTATARKPKAAPAPVVNDETPPWEDQPTTKEDEDDMAFFQRLADE